MPYLGNEPAVAYTSTTKDSFSGDASTTDFTMSKSANVNAVRVVVENVVQDPGVAYTCSGTTLTFTSAPPTGTNNIYVVHLGPPAATVAPPTTINNPTTFTGGVTLKNETPEDTDGGRESIVTFQGTQSGSEISTLAQIQASHDGTSDDEKADLIFKTNDGSDGASPTEAMRIDSAGRVGIGITPAAVSDSTGAPTLQLGGTFLIHFDEDGAGTTTLGNNLYYNGTANKALFAGSTSQYYQAGGTHVWRNSGSTSAGSTATLSESMRIDSSGNLIVGKTSTAFGTAGGTYAAAGNASLVTDGGSPLFLNRLQEGGMIELYEAGTARGQIDINSDRLLLRSSGSAAGLRFDSGSYTPFYGGGASDNGIDLGFAGGRFKVVFAGTGSINTSDENEKQDIAELTDAEIVAAKAISKLFKTYKWKDVVSSKGDAARTHVGVIAQQVQTAMSDAGLDASKYGFWCSDTWWETKKEVDAVEADEENDIKAQDAYTDTRTYKTEDEAPEGATKRTRMGIRYAELLAFIGAATEQRLTSIESRLTALEAG